MPAVPNHKPNSRLLYHLSRIPRGIYRRFHRWFFYQNRLAGRVVELLGNKGHIDGLVFYLDNPYIATPLKSRFLFHSYEDGAEALISQYVREDLPVIEFGGCIGVISCLINRQLRDPTAHVVVEAQPFLIDTLTANRDRNGCQFEILNAAVAYGNDVVDFWIDPECFVGNSTKEKEGGELVRVPGISLQQTLEDRGYDRITLVVDIEGAETQLVEHELPLLCRVVETLIMELHPSQRAAGRDAIEKLERDLAHAGFEQIDQVGYDYVYRNTGLSQR